MKHESKQITTLKTDHRVRVRRRIFRHRTPRQWVLAVILAVTSLYVLVGLVFSWQIYQKHHTSVIPTAVRLYPLPAGRVGTTFIPLARYWRDVLAIRIYVKESGTEAKYSGQDIEKQVMDRLVRAATVRRLARQYNVIVSTKEVDDAYNAAAANEGDLIEKNLKKYYNFSPADFKVWIYESLIERKANDAIPLRRNVSHILVAVDASASADDVEIARQKAVDLKAKIVAGQDFGDTAKQESNDASSRDQSGSLGWVSRGQSGSPLIDQAFEDAVFTAPLNQVTDPVRSSRGWHLILVKEQTGQVNGSFESIVKDEMTRSHVVTYLP